MKKAVFILLLMLLAASISAATIEYKIIYFTESSSYALMESQLNSYAGSGWILFSSMIGNDGRYIFVLSKKY